MTEQTINELTNFFQKFGKEEAKQPAQSNLLFDDAVKYFFSNMEERGLHCPTIPKIESIAKSLNIEPYQLFINFDRDKNIINKMRSGRQYNQK